ncbi:MAG: MFS transporter [Candidatus Brocadiae bacterium]|nr:MFS transporter [Candidatus Brocadiia bacterium]
MTAPAPAAPPALPAPDPRERDFVRNVTCLTLVESGWGFGMAFGFSAAFMQVVLKRLGATETEVGLLAAQWGIGTIPMVLSGYLTGHLRRKKTVVLWGHFLCVLPVGALAVALASGASDRAKIWYILAAEYMFSFAVGLLLPVWFTFMGKVMPARKLGRGLGITFAFQTLCGLIASLAASFFLERRPDAVPLCVGATAGLMLLGNLFFFPVREPETDADARPAGFLTWIRDLFAEFRRHPSVRRFLVAELLFTFQAVIVGFYGSRAVDFGGNVAVGARLAAFMTGCQAVSSFVGGWLVDRVGPKPVLIGGRLAVVAAAAFAATADSVSALYPAAASIGIFFGVRSTAGFAMFREVLGREEVTSLWGMFTLLVSPVAAAAPLVAGYLMTRKVISAPVAFTVAGSLVLLSALVLLLGVRGRRAA